MAAAQVQEEVLNDFYGQAAPAQAEGQDVPWDTFNVSQTNFNDWLHVLRMDVNPGNIYRHNVAIFSQNVMRGKAFDAIKNEISNLGSIKAQFGLEIHFTREKQNADGTMGEEKQRHYFKGAVSRYCTITLKSFKLPMHQWKP